MAVIYFGRQSNLCRSPPACRACTAAAVVEAVRGPRAVTVSFPVRSARPFPFLSCSPAAPATARLFVSRKYARRDDHHRRRSRWRRRRLPRLIRRCAALPHPPQNPSLVKDLKPQGEMRTSFEWSPQRRRRWWSVFLYPLPLPCLPPAQTCRVRRGRAGGRGRWRCQEVAFGFVIWQVGVLKGKLHKKSDR